MKPRTFALVALTIPFAAIAVVMAPILVVSFGDPAGWNDVLETSAAFGLPQYAVFGLALAIATRRMSGSGIRRLALWAPLLFVPFLLAPFVWANRGWRDGFAALALMSGLGLAVGYACVGIALGLWPAFVVDADSPAPPRAC
jgi:hypothetical protein